MTPILTSTMNSEDDIESLLDIFSSNQVQIGDSGTFVIKGEEALLSEGQEKMNMFAQNDDNNDSHNMSINVKTPGEASLNSSGYFSASSPEESITNTKIIHINPPGQDSSGSGHSNFNSPEDVSNVRVITIQPPTNPNVNENDGGNTILPNVINFNPESIPTSSHQPIPSSVATSQPGSLAGGQVEANFVTPSVPMYQEDAYHTPVWFKTMYPELYYVWHQTSASEFYQGGVQMLCSTCKKHPASGFHEGLPLCEACRVGLACTACRIRVASCFSYGLALCEADRIFLYRVFANRTQYNKCQVLCPVTVQKWCGYCRLRTCLSCKGFRFMIQASTKHLLEDQGGQGTNRKRKYSGKGVYRELNFVPEPINQDSINVPRSSSRNGTICQPTPSVFFVNNQSYPAPTPKTQQSTIPSYHNYAQNHLNVHQGYISNSSFQVPRTMTNQSYNYINHFLVPGAGNYNQNCSRPSSIYDGSGLGLSDKRDHGGLGLTNDPSKAVWVAQQQEKYLQYHLNIFKSRSKKR